MDIDGNKGVEGCDCDFTDTSSPSLSTSIPSLITTVPPASNACSKLISTRDVRLIVLLSFLSPRDAFGWSPDGKEDGGTGERGVVVLRNMDARVPIDDASEDFNENGSAEAVRNVEQPAVVDPLRFQLALADLLI